LRVSPDSPVQRLDAHGRSVAQDLCHALHQLVRIVADADHCVGPRSVRLDQHGVESLLASSFSELRKERDVAANQRLEGGTDGAENRSGPDDDTAYHAQIVHYSESRNVEAGRCHVGRNVCCLRMDNGRHGSDYAVRDQLILRLAYRVAHVGYADACYHLRVAKDGWRAGEVVEEPNSGAKKYRRDVDVDFVEEPGIQ